jgi:FkbM family methyltransferase
MFQQVKAKLKKLISVVIFRIADNSLYTRTTYSQCGEDLQIVTALNLIKGDVPFTYLDIGANDPYVLSNTALMYKKGGKGFLIEPNPELVNRLKNERGDRDCVLQCGISYSDEIEAEFYLMESHVLSTFSKDEAARYEQLGHKLLNKINVPLRNVNEVLEMTGLVDFMNIDVEGLDEKILRSVDWKRHRPICICVETITYETNI